MIEHIAVSSTEPEAIRHKLMEEAQHFVVAGPAAIDYELVDQTRRVLTERKTVDDLAGAFMSANEATGEPRIMAQLRHMAELSGPETLLVLLVEGHLRNREGFLHSGRHGTGLPFNAVDNFLMVVQRWGVRIAHSASTAHTPARLISIAESWLSDVEKGPIVRLPRAPTPQMRTILTLPGVGPVMAKRLSEHYDNLGELLFDALAERWPDIPRLGPKGRAKVSEFLEAPLVIEKRG